MKISIYWLFVNFGFPDFQSFKFLMKSFLQVCHSVKPKVFVKHCPGPGGEPRVFESQSDVLLKDPFAVRLSGGQFSTTFEDTMVEIFEESEKP